MQQPFRGPPKAVILFCKCTWTWHLILSRSAEWQGFIVRQVQHDAKFNLSTKRHDKRGKTRAHSAKHELWINDGHWAVQTGKEDVRRRLQRKIWALQRGPRPPLCAQDHKVSFCKSIYGNPGPVCLPPAVHYSRKAEVQPHHVKRAALWKNLCFETLFFEGVVGVQVPGSVFFKILIEV